MKNKLYHRILAVVLTVAMTMTSLPAAAMVEMADDVSASMSSAQMSDPLEEASEEMGNNSGEEAPNSEATQSEASLGNESQEPEQSQESLTPSLEDTQDEQVAPTAEITATEGTAIRSTQDLQGINNNLSGSYYLTQDIDLTGVSFTPIGSKDTPFTGTFDGNGYEITNLTIDSEASYQGLFGYVKNGTVKNVGVTGSVKGSHCVGGIAGCVETGGIIENCYSEATVTGSDNNVGGVAGYVWSGGSVSNCYNTGAVSANSTSSSTYVGGVAGYVSGSVENCYNTGVVSANSTTSSDADAYAGGVAGYVTGGVSNCYNTGAVSANSNTNAGAGGMAGYVWSGGSVSNCYNTGAVSATSTSSYAYTEADAGGVAGYMYGGSVNSCYNTGTVSANSNTNAEAGGVAGSADETVSNCYNTGAVSANSTSSYADTDAGGVAGYVSGSLRNCYNTGAVSVTSSYDDTRVDAGGVAGFVHGSVENCYNTGVVSANSTTSSDADAYAGGVAGCVTGQGSVSNCYNTGAVYVTSSDANADAGGVAGKVEGSVSNCYYNTDTKGDATKAVGVGTAGDNVSGLTTEQMSGSDALNQMQFTDPTAWVTLANAKNGDGSVKTYYYPQLSVFVKDPKNPKPEEMPIASILISTADELQAINNNLSGNYMLANDIDLSGFVFTPIGGLANPFIGTFDGNGHKVSNLTIGYNSSYYQGLFSYVKDGTVKNVGVTGCVSGKGDVGGIVGYLSGGTIENCYSEVMVRGDSGYVGGVVGTMDGKVKNCYNTGTVTGDASIGGIAGYVTGSISNCYNTGKVFGSSRVGGVAGLIYGSVIDCYNTGEVTGNDAYTGGVAGSVMSGSVSNCYYNKNNAGNAKKAVGYGTAGANVAGLTTAQMSGSDALNQMKFTDPTAWVTLANAKNSNGTVKTYYYPQLKVFVANPYNPQPEEMPSTAGVALIANAL